MTNAAREGSGAPRLAAIVLDVDGTLYDPSPVRRRMMLRLARAYALRPRAGWRALRALAAYRRGQEVLRRRGAEGDLARAQLEHAAHAMGVPRAEIEALVAEWMERRPLDLVAAARRPGLTAFLRAARAAGVGVGVFSDYPPEAKLRALGLAPDAVAWAQEPEVGRFKPDPRGLLRVLERLGAAPGQSLYVGDRPEVDAAAAARAGMPCALVGRPGGAPAGEPWVGVGGFEELTEALFPAATLARFAAPRPPSPNPQEGPPR